MRLVFIMLFIIAFVVAVLFYTKQNRREITSLPPKKTDLQFVVMEYSYDAKKRLEHTFKEIQDKGMRTVFIQGDVKENDLNQFAYFENTYDLSIVPVSRKRPSSQKIKFAGVPVFKGGTFLAETADDISVQKNEYKICSIEQNSRIKCDEKYSFGNNPKSFSEINLYNQFLQELRELIDKEHVQKQMSLEEAKLDGRHYATTYLNVRKPYTACSFPPYGIKVEGGGLYKEYKMFRSVRMTDDSLFVVLSNAPSSKDYIDKVWFYYPSVDPQYCKNFTISFYTYDFNQDLQEFRMEFPRYTLSIEQPEYKKMLAAIPASQEARLASGFTFPYVNSVFTFKNKKYITKVKNRGLSLVHWLQDKKSYTLKFIDPYQDNEKLLLYIPEKTAYNGEYITSKLAQSINLPSLESHFGDVIINGKNFGIYYVTEDFDKYFLAKRSLTEANIYTAGISAPLDSYEVSAIPKELFTSTINAFENDFERDIDHFLESIKLDHLKLSQEWRYRFDEDNLKKMLALMVITGTIHYNAFNMVFYINPVNGKILFFPWDFMNYSQVGDLQREDLQGFPNDYLNINRIFSKLLLIPEIRDLRNQEIYTKAEILLDLIEDFSVNENINLIANYLNDKTTPFFAGPYNRPEFFWALDTPFIIQRNIEYLKEKISEINSEAFIKTLSDKRYSIKVISNSFSTLELDQMIIEGLVSSDIQQVNIDNKKISSMDIGLRDDEEGHLELTFNNKQYLHPLVLREKKYGSPIRIKPVELYVEIILRQRKDILNSSLLVKNSSTGQTKNIQVEKSEFAKTFQPPIESANQKKKQFSHPQLKFSGHPNEYTFNSKEVEITENLVISEDTTLIIKPGTRILLGEGKSLISYGKIIARGTKANPIIFSSLRDKKQWGVVALLEKESEGEFENCLFEYGGDSYIRGAYFSGMLSSYYADVKVNNCTFSFANRRSGDDGVNVKYGLAVIKNSSFLQNSADAIDLDYVKEGSRIENNVIENSGGDGVDISESKSVTIKKNTISSSGDKGVSVGEASVVFMIQNSISNSTFGVAAKDSSLVKVIQNDITNNKIGIAAYNKKENYGGARIYVTNTLLKHNKQDFGLEIIGAKDNQIIVSHSTYRLTGTKTNEIIQMPSKISVSKKKVLELVLSNQLDVLKDNVVQFATLVDYAQKNYVEDEANEHLPVGRL